MKVIMNYLMKYGAKVLNSKVVKYILSTGIAQKLILKYFKKGGVNMLEKLGMLLVPKILDTILEDEKTQEWIKDLGRDIGQEIPGDVAEPRLNKAVDLIQEGMMETVNKK